eukprot:c24266_g4_i1 orf=83-364(-)
MRTCIFLSATAHILGVESSPGNYLYVGGVDFIGTPHTPSWQGIASNGPLQEVYQSPTKSSRHSQLCERGPFPFTFPYSIQHNELLQRGRHVPS